MTSVSNDRPAAGQKVQRSKLHTSEVWAGMAVITVGVVALIGAAQIPSAGQLSDPLGPRAFPLALGIVAIVLGAVLAIRAVLTSERTGADVGYLRTVGVIALAVVAYVGLLLPLGYPMMTFLFLGGLFRFLGEQRVWLCGLVAALLSAALYAGFSYGLGVALPLGFGL